MSFHYISKKLSVTLSDKDLVGLHNAYTKLVISGCQKSDIGEELVAIVEISNMLDMEPKGQSNGTK